MGWKRKRGRIVGWKRAKRAREPSLKVTPKLLSMVFTPPNDYSMVFIPPNDPMTQVCQTSLLVLGFT